MKKTLSALLTVLLLFASLSACSSTDDEKSNEPSDPAVSQATDVSNEAEESSQTAHSTIVTDEDSGQSYDLSEYSPIGTEGAAKIIIKVEDVGKVLDDRFMNNTEITHVYIEDGIETIDDFAFSCCTALKDVRLPRTLKSWGTEKGGGGIFMGCKSLESIYIPEGIEYICEQAFFGCSSLKSVHLPEGITGLGIQSLNETALTEINLPSTLKTISKGAIPKSVTVLNLPDNIESIWSIWADTVVYVTEGSKTYEVVKQLHDCGEFIGEIKFK